MSFYYPLGLLGLIGVPVLIIIYIIKSKYTEQTVASTYLWELSEKFLKKRKPISKLTGILTLILQILAVIAASLLIAHPVFVIPDSANDFYFILDGSASMQMTRDGSTRFEKAQAKINEIIDGSRTGSSYTLIFANDDVTVSFEGVRDKEQAKVFVNALGAGWSAADCSSAMTFAQEYFDLNPSAEIYLVTDKEYETENMTLVDVSESEENYALYSVGSRSAGNLTGQVISYSADKELTVELYAVAEAGAEPEKIAETSVSAKTGEPCDFALSGESGGYIALELRISDGDALSNDNVIMLYDETANQQKSVIIVNGSNDVSYIYNAIVNAGKVPAENIRIIDRRNYNPSMARGAGLCVFNGYAPATLPTNCAVWLIKSVDGSSSESGVVLRRKDVEPEDAEGENSYFIPSYIADRRATEQAKRLMKDIMKEGDRNEIVVRKYDRYTARNAHTVLEYNGDPLIFAGLNANNDRQVTFAFSVGDTNFGLSANFLILVRNLMDYSFPPVIEEVMYDCGDVMNVNVVPGCLEIAVTSPSQNTTVLDTQGKDVCEVPLGEQGTYAFTVTTSGGAQETLYVYSRVPEAESRNEGGATLQLSGTKEYNYSDGYYDELLAFFIAIALLLLADWGIYCYEQYQLR